MLKAKVKSVDVNGTRLADYLPPDLSCFGVWLTASIGETDSAGADFFQFLVCSSTWLDDSEGITLRSGQRYLEIQGAFNPDIISAALDGFVSGCDGRDWHALAAALSTKGYWEFENYRR